MPRYVLTLAAALVAAGAAAADSREPVYPYSPYSGEGRYTMEKGERAKRIQHLETVAARFGTKPYEALWDRAARDGLGAWQTERLVFHDVTTGARIVRLTNDYGSDYVDYHRGAWNADGSIVLWRRRPGMWESSTETNGPTAVTSDGRTLYPVFRDAPGSRLVRKYQCDRHDPRP